MTATTALATPTGYRTIAADPYRQLTILGRVPGTTSMQEVILDTDPTGLFPPSLNIPEVCLTDRQGMAFLRACLGLYERALDADNLADDPLTVAVPGATTGAPAPHHPANQHPDATFRCNDADSLTGLRVAHASRNGAAQDRQPRGRDQRDSRGRRR